MADEELEKLRQRVEKDPASRLFLPLAEEYRKAGRLDDAITVLLKGLDQHPGYTSARVAMGRIYLEKDLSAEARAEFEKVVSVVPDNLFAHKKLAEIYRESGEVESAVSEYKTILALNPLDDDARACLDSLSGLSPEPAEALPPDEGAASEAAAVFPLEKEAGEELTEGHLKGEPADETGGAEEIELGESAAFDYDFEEFSKSFSEGAEPAGTESEGIVTEIPLEDAEDLSAGPVVSLSEAASEEHAGEEIALDEANAAVIDFSEADACVARGDYAKAIDMYSTILRKSPESTQVLQRISELKAFIKMIGKGDDVIASRLEGLLSGIRRRFGRG